MRKYIFLSFALAVAINSCNSQERNKPATRVAVATNTNAPAPAKHGPNTSGRFSGVMNGIALECLPTETYKGAFMNRMSKDQTPHPSIVKSFKCKGGWGVFLDIPYNNGQTGTSDDLSISGDIPGDVVFAKKGAPHIVKTTRITWAPDSSEFYYSGEFSAELCDLAAKKSYPVKGTIENLAVHVPPHAIRTMFKALGSEASERARNEKK